MLLRLDEGTDTAADASGLPGENRVEFPFRHGGKQNVAFSGGFLVRLGFFHAFCRTCHAIADHAWLILAV